MDKVELIGKMQMVYVGDRNAFNELVEYYDRLQQENKKLKEKLNKIEKYASELEEQYWWFHKDICKIIGDSNE